MLKSVIYKILICIILVCTLFQYSFINILYAKPVDENGNEIPTAETTTGSTQNETIDQNENVTTTDDNNLSDEVDDDTGTILGPLLEILRAVGDAIMSVLTKCMLGTSFEKVMVKWKELDKSNLAEANTTKTFSQEEIDEFKKWFGTILPELKYPNFKYTPEEIFKGQIDLFSIDFISGKVVKDGTIQDNSSDGWNALRKNISTWYKTLRTIAIVGLLAILIYLGIGIIISSSAGKKADFKKSLINWAIAMLLLFSMHYIMAFIISVVQNFTTLLSNSIGNLKVVFGDKVFLTNFMGLARFQAQVNSFINQIEYIFIYLAFISLTFKFTFIYFKRMINIALLTILSPFVAMMYPLDKNGGGKAKGFSFWLQEYIYNALLQPMHLLLYTILIGSAVQISVNNPVYTIVALFFLVQAEKLFKKMFGFGRARGGTVGGLAQTVGAMAMASSMGKSIRSILKPSQQGNSGKLKESGSSGNLSKADDDLDAEDDEDERFYRRYGSANSHSGNSNPFGVDKSIYNMRPNLTDDELKNARQGLGEFGKAFDYLKQNGMKKGKNGELNKKTRQALKHMEETIRRNEDPFTKANIPLQYNDEFSKLNSNQLLEKIRECLKNGDTEGAQKYFNVLNRRMQENKYMRMHGGPRAFLKRKFSNLTDSELKERFEEAKANNSIEDILECEAEFALRSNDYVLYEAKLEEIEKYRLGVTRGTDSEGTGGQNDEGNALHSGSNHNSNQNDGQIDSGEEQGNIQEDSGTGESNIGSGNSDNVIRGFIPSLFKRSKNRAKPSSGIVRGRPGMIIGNQDIDSFEDGEEDMNMRGGFDSYKGNKRTGGGFDSYKGNRRTDGGFDSYKGYGNKNGRFDSYRGRSNKFDRVARGTISGVKSLGREIVKPVWDTNKKPADNLSRLGKNVAKGTIQGLVGITSVAVQAGISLADGKYSPKEAAASFVGGAAAGGKLYHEGEKIVKGAIREYNYGRSEEERKTQIAKDWSERDDVNKQYKETYGRKADKMLSLATDGLAKEGITDFNEQRKVFRYTNYLIKKNSGLSEKEAVKEAVKVYKFKKYMDSTYGMPSNEASKKERINQMARENGSSKSSDQKKSYYSKMISEAEAFEVVEEDYDYDYFE